MAKRHHTIILIPHAHAKLRKWQITSLQIGIVTAALLLLTFAAAFFIWSRFSTDVNPVEIAHLKLENERLNKTNLTFEASLRKLQNQLAEYEERTRQLAIVAGGETLESGVEAGIGGDTPTDEVEIGDL